MWAYGRLYGSCNYCFGKAHANGRVTPIAAVQANALLIPCTETQYTAYLSVKVTVRESTVKASTTRSSSSIFNSIPDFSCINTNNHDNIEPTKVQCVCRSNITFTMCQT